MTNKARAQKPQLLVGAHIFDGERTLENHALLIENGCIIEVLTPKGTQEFLVQSSGKSSDSVEVVHLDGGLLAPGFIDTQVNGGGGALFNHDTSVSALATMAKAHRQFGTTSLLPTLITDETTVMQAAIEAVQNSIIEEVPGIIGYHLEGPFLNPNKNGIHRQSMIRAFDETLLPLLKTSLPNIAQQIENGVRMMTLAPEQQQAGTIRQLSEAGIIISAGHTQATYEEIQSAIDEGLSGFTHVFNAMSTLQSRAPGAVGAALDAENAWCGIIVDGHHVHPASLRIAIRAKRSLGGRGKMMLVTDAMHSVGANKTELALFDETLYLQGGKLTNADGTLAGSHLSMIEAVKNCVELVGLDKEEALRMASTYPAEFLKLDQKLGLIKPNYIANLVHISDDWQVLNTWIHGFSERV